MAEIKIAGGFIALVDDEDYEIVNKYKWRVIEKNLNTYATTSIRKGGKKATVRMHRLIMNPPADMQVDHKNHNGLDNRRHNLRVCTASQNGANRRKQAGMKYKYRGIWFDKRAGKFGAQIKVNYKLIHIGFYDDDAAAARAYDEKAKELFGEFANTNF